MTTRECMHSVTGSYFRSRKNDGGHAIRSAEGENPMLRAHFTAVCVIDAELLATEFLHCAEADTRRQWAYVVDLFRLLWPWPWPWPDDLHIRTWPYCVEIHRMCKYKLPAWSYRLTEGQTYRIDRNYRARRFAGGRSWSSSSPTWYLSLTSRSSLSTRTTRRSLSASTSALWRTLRRNAESRAGRSS